MTKKTNRGIKPVNEQKITALREQIMLIERDYWITQTKLLPHQQEVWDACSQTKRKMFNWEHLTVPKNKFVVMQWGNGVGKSFTLYYTTACFAIGRQWAKYNLPYVGSRKKIMIVTQSSWNVTEYVEPYLLGENSPCRIPPEMIAPWGIKRGSECVKSIKLTNGCLITIKTVEQGQKRLVGANPDMLVVDEPIEKDEVWNELIARLRSPKAFLLYWFTPINWFNASYYFLYEQESEKIRDTTRIIRCRSTENVYQDHTALLGLSETEKKMRIDGDFTPLTGLVYYAFDRNRHLIPPVNPKTMWEWTRFVWGLDFWTVHPFWFAAIAIDKDNRKYLFDSVKASNLSLKEIRDEVWKIEKKWGIKFERITADSAGKRERLELWLLWLKTEKAKKWKDLETWEKGRTSSILLINNEFKNDKILIGWERDGINDEFVKELQNHCYAPSGNWVIKENDDILDAFRYAYIDIKKEKVKTVAEKRFEEKWGVKNNNKFKSY